MQTDGVVTPVAPIQRALSAAVEKLNQSSDFEVVPYQPILGKEAWEIIVSRALFGLHLTLQSKLYWPDKGKMVYDHIAKSGEPVLPLTEWIISHSKDNTGTLEESLAVSSRAKPLDLADKRADGRPTRPVPRCCSGSLAKVWHRRPPYSRRPHSRPQARDGKVLERESSCNSIRG
jgi:hypothetical protein